MSARSTGDVSQVCQRSDSHTHLTFPWHPEEKESSTWRFGVGNKCTYAWNA
jgi:hypothetical protein